MAETIQLILTKFTDETITVFSLLLLVTMIGIIIYWFYNRKKFHQLSHEIPASVVKNYLDSIIQNSNSLKSSLFRGGGLDMGNGIPSVVPVSDLPSSHSIGVGIGSEEVTQKNAEISALTQKLSDRQLHIQDLEKTIRELSSASTPNPENEVAKRELLEAKRRIQELESMPRSEGDGGNNEALEGELREVTEERDELKERLKEYAIIEEDLANLKRLQQENDQLKAELKSLRNGQPAAAIAVEEEKIAEPLIEEEVVEEVIEVAPVAAAEEEVDDFEAAMAAAIAESSAQVSAPKGPAPQVLDVNGSSPKEQDQKSAEELLSEFEKMLG